MSENITPREWGQLRVGLRLDVHKAVEGAVELLTTEVYGTLPGLADPPVARRDYHLARVAALDMLAAELGRLTGEAAWAAGHVEGAPATYADLGVAVGISRQAAAARFRGAVPDAKPGRPKKQVTVRLEGGHPYWDGRSLEFDRDAVYDCDLDDVGGLLMIPDGSFPDELEPGVDWRAHYAPESETTRTTWVFQGWVPS